MAILEALKLGATVTFYTYACIYLALLIIRDYKAKDAPKETEAQEEPQEPVTAKKYVYVEKMEKYREAILKYIDEKTQQLEKKAADPAPEDTTTDGLAPCPICHSKVNAELEQWPGWKKLTITCDRCGLSFENSQDFSSYTTPVGEIRYVATSEDPIIMWNRVAGKGNKQPETVRCKDCIYNKHRTEGTHILNWCGKFDNVMRDNDFCSFGEKPAYERRNNHE